MLKRTAANAASVFTTTIVVAILTTCIQAQGATLQVGPGHPYAKPCAAFAAAAPGDTIEIDAAGNGSYNGDVCGLSKANLTIRGINGRAHIDAAGHNFQGKAIWVISGANTAVENIEFSGASSVDHNGAGIRQQGQNLTLRNCYFHDNEDGILVDSNTGDLLIEFTEFEHNGYGDGLSHNLYVNHVNSLTFRYNYSHRGKNGHLLKSRAANNYILYNRITDESKGFASYEIDLPNGGTSFIIGNLIEKSPAAKNPSVISYQEEGVHALNPGHDLYLVNNTIVDDMHHGNIVSVDASVLTPAVLLNNIFMTSGTMLITQAIAINLDNLITATDPGFHNLSLYDYRLTGGSAAIGAGGSIVGLPATTLAGAEYLHPVCFQTRALVGTIDVGGFEYGNIPGSVQCGTGAALTGFSPSLSVSSSNVPSGTAMTATLQLNQVATGNGVIAFITSSDTSVTVPTKVNIPAGQNSATFSVKTAATTNNPAIVISALAAGSTATASFAAAPAGTAIQSITSSDSSGTTLTVNLTGPAPAGGTLVTLSASSLIAHIPTTILVPATQPSVSFSPTYDDVSAATAVVFSATYIGVKRTVTITRQPGVSNVVFIPAPQTGGVKSTTNKITLQAAAPVGGAQVTLTSSNPALAAVSPATLIIPAGSTTGVFTITSVNVLSSTTVNISATYHGTTTRTLTLIPVAVSFISVPTSAIGGQTLTTPSIHLTGPAPSPNAAVTVSSSKPAAASVTSPVTIGAGLLVGTFTISTHSVAVSTPVTITVSYGGVTKTATLTVNP